MKKYWILLAGFLIIGFSCVKKNTKTLQSAMMTKADINYIDLPSAAATCRDKMSYIPDEKYPEHTPLRFVKINFHVMRNGKGEGNFETDEEAITYIETIYGMANRYLQNNQKMNLPIGNNTPVFPIKYRYLLTPDPSIPNDKGIYFHNDEDLYYYIAKGKNSNRFRKDQFKKYAVQPDEVLNIFMMEHHQDSLKSKTYEPKARGNAFPTWLKVNGLYYDSKDSMGEKDGKPIYKGAWYSVGLFNHELGHTLGLRHTWAGNDGCDDTPQHSNCWSKSTGPPCNMVGSNNVMDYNTYQRAWSPCQIGTVQYNFSRPAMKTRALLQKRWCTLKEKEHIVIQDSIVWDDAKDLEGHITIANGGDLTINCKVALPKGAKITIAPKGRLTLNGGMIYNDCGEEWAGVEIQSQGKDKGEVRCANKATFENMAN